MYTKVYSSLPEWLSLSRPQPEGQVVNVRRECQVALDIRSKELLALSGQRPVKWKGLVIPSTPGLHNQQGPDPSLYIITSQLDQLYTILQEICPDWCRAHPFLALVQGQTYQQLCELHVSWVQWFEHYEVQLRPSVPVVYVPLSIECILHLTILILKQRPDRAAAEHKLFQPTLRF